MGGGAGRSGVVGNAWVGIDRANGVNDWHIHQVHGISKGELIKALRWHGIDAWRGLTGECSNIKGPCHCQVGTLAGLLETCDAALEQGSKRNCQHQH